MLDIHRRETAAPNIASPIEFLRIQLAPLLGGTILASLTATTVDEEEPGLLDQEIVTAPVATVDELITLIREHVRIGLAPAAPLARSN